MARQFFLFERPSRFVAGTVGEPGERTFFLQAVDGVRVVSVALEKQQVAVLADRLEQLLDEVVARTGTALPASDSDTDALEVPIDEEFRVSAMGLAWDGDAGLVIIEAQAPTEDAEVGRADAAGGRRGRPGRAARAHRADPRAGVRRARPPGDLGRPTAVPAVRAAARRRRARVPAAERLPPRHHARAVDRMTRGRAHCGGRDAGGGGSRPARDRRTHHRGTPARRVQRDAVLRRHRRTA